MLRKPKRKEPEPPSAPPKKRQVPKKVTQKKVTVKKNSPKQVKWNSKTFLLTFPQWEGEETLEQLKQKLFTFWEDKGKKVEEAIICIEDHGPVEEEEIKSHSTDEDPGRHIHMCFKLDKAHTVRKADFFDNLGGKHGDIQTCRNYKACQIYCAKDNDYITHNVDIDAVVKSTKSKKGVKHETVANFIMKRPRDVKQVTLKYPGYVIQHQSKVSDFIKLIKTFEDDTIPYPGIDQDKLAGLPEPTLRIIEWLQTNLPPAIRPMKQKQLWIYGPSNTGKTTLREDLAKWFNSYHVAIEGGHWWSGFSEDSQIAFFEEFNGYKTMSQLKQFLDGSTMGIPIKGERMPLYKKKNIPCIILSNHSPEEVYRKAITEDFEKLAPILERIDVIEVKEFIKIPWREPEVFNIDLTGPSSLDDDGKEEVEEVQQEQQESEGDVVPPTPPRPLKRGKVLYGNKLAELLHPDELLVAGSQSSEEVVINPPDPYDHGVQPDPYNEDDEESEESEYTIQQRIMRKLNKKNKK